MLDRRTLLVSAATAAAASCAKAQGAERDILVYRTETCGCCKGWMTHLTRAGFIPREQLVDDVAKLTSARGVPLDLTSCHMGEIGGYIVIGHVPPTDVQRLLKEKPRALGLTVPGMPIGSPGMESPTGEKEPYQTLLLLTGGGTRVFAQHG